MVVLNTDEDTHGVSPVLQAHHPPGGGGNQIVVGNRLGAIYGLLHRCLRFVGTVPKQVPCPETSVRVSLLFVPQLQEPWEVALIKVPEKAIPS